jgi:hypothetical protein
MMPAPEPVPRVFAPAPRPPFGLLATAKADDARAGAGAPGLRAVTEVAIVLRVVAFQLVARVFHLLRHIEFLSLLPLRRGAATVRLRNGAPQSHKGATGTRCQSLQRPDLPS